MKNIQVLFIVLFISLLFIFPTHSRANTNDMYIFVDATELPRKLLHSQIKFKMPDNAALLYPKWWFGHHGPVGAIGNMAGLNFTNSNGETIKWERDWTDVYRFFLGETIDDSWIQANLTYICNQPTANTKGCDSYGYPQIGVINWNTIAIYPEGIPVSDINVHLKLILPKTWQYGSALPFDHVSGDTLIFKPVTFEEFIDMPLIGGTNFRTVKYGSTEMADYYLHIAADDAEFLPKNDSTFFAFTRLAHEAEALFGRTHFDEYHFLLTVSDLIPGIGLEHRNSSLNGVNADAFKDVHEYDTGLRGVIPHEFVHAWCGKYRRPAGMNTFDYQTTKNMDLLWVYEGLTTYLGSVLKVRAGFIDIPTFLDEQANSWGRSYNQKGRKWRSLRDTQVANYTIRKDSDSWSNLRRNQDYYSEGAMIWLDFDSRIREATDGQKSLDDFCVNFFGRGDPTAHAISFDLEDVISVLNELTDKESWAQLIDQKINQTENEFNPEGITNSGYKFTLSKQKSDVQKLVDAKYYNRRSFNKSIGMDVEKNGVISNIVPGGPADLTGLYDGIKVVGVNGKTYNIDRLENAVRNTTTTGKLTLLILEADTYYEYEINYEGGLKYDKLEPIPGQKDWLTEILTPKVIK